MRALWVTMAQNRMNFVTDPQMHLELQKGGLKLLGILYDGPRQREWVMDSPGRVFCE